MMKLFGAHVSAAGGAYNAPENAKAIGANCVQIFGSSPRQWDVRIPSDEDVEKFHQEVARLGIKSVFLHAPYLINLATPKKNLLIKSKAALKGHFEIANKFGAEGLIFHLGSHKDSTLPKGIAQTAKVVKEVLKQVPGKSQLILETSSGGGDKVGDSIDELAQLFKKIGSQRTSLCFDTAHAFTAGMLDYSPSSIREFVTEWDTKIGLNNISVIHVNDSKADYLSKVDRHENLGKGKIGLAGLKRFAKQKSLRNLPWILEVPGFDKQGPDRKNVNILKAF